MPEDDDRALEGFNLKIMMSRWWWWCRRRIWSLRVVFAIFWHRDFERLLNDVIKWKIEPMGQSYKHYTMVIYEPRVILAWILPRVVNCWPFIWICHCKTLLQSKISGIDLYSLLPFSLKFGGYYTQIIEQHNKKLGRKRKLFYIYFVFFWCNNIQESTTYLPALSM